MNLSNSDTFKIFKNTPLACLKQESYFWVYDEIFKRYRGQDIVFVEIGVLSGGSLLMWRDFFGPNARIIGIELNPDAKRFEQEGKIEIFIGDQSSDEFWDDFLNQVPVIDVLLDDGGHTNSQQIKTAYRCLPIIRDGGLLVTEDTHTSYSRLFGNPHKYSFINYAKYLIDCVNSRFCLMPDGGPFETNISHITFFQSVVCMHIDRNKNFKSKTIGNNGNIVITKNYTYEGTMVSRSEQFRASLSSLAGRFLSPAVSRLANRLFNQYMSLVFRYQNYQSRQFFKGSKRFRY